MIKHGLGLVLSTALFCVHPTAALATINGGHDALLTVRVSNADVTVFDIGFNIISTPTISASFDVEIALNDVAGTVGAVPTFLDFAAAYVMSGDIGGTPFSFSGQPDFSQVFLSVSGDDETHNFNASGQLFGNYPDPNAPSAPIPAGMLGSTPGETVDLRAEQLYFFLNGFASGPPPGAGTQINIVPAVGQPAEHH